MKRRDLFKISATLPALASGSPGALAAQVAAPSWKPAVFDTHQNNTVVALTELIIPATDTPGAKAAGVNRYLDLILRDSPALRIEILEGLGWLDGFARTKHGKPFVACTSAEQTSMLEALDAGSDSQLEPGTRFFRSIKSQTARIYYATEIGVRELNKGGRVPASFGCTHPEHA